MKEHEKEPLHGGRVGTQDARAPSPPLEDLMSTGTESDEARGSDLEARARRAAEFEFEVVDDVEAGADAAGTDVDDEADDGAAVEAGDDVAVAAAAAAAAASRPSRTDRIVQVLLVLNLLLIGVVIALPSSSKTGGGEAAPTPRAAEGDALVQPPRQLGNLPSHELWQRSLAAAGKGDYAQAVDLLERYLSGPGVTDLERQLVYNQLAYYLVKDGRMDAAREYTLKAQQLLTRAYLPEDLLDGARKAEANGAHAEMRSAYARFLLQLRQASPELRQREAEAYLKLGDSFRLEAQRPPTMGPEAPGRSAAKNNEAKADAAAPGRDGAPAPEAKDPPR